MSLFTGISVVFFMPRLLSQFIFSNLKWFLNVFLESGENNGFHFVPLSISMIKQQIDMNNIEALLSELGRASMSPENSTYNGITEMESSISYQMMIEKLYNSAVSDLYDLDEPRRGIVMRRIDEVREIQLFFDVPSTETVNLLVQDYNAQPEGKRNKSLLDDYRYCRFVLECVAIQKHYLQRFASLLTVYQETQTTDTPNDNKPNTTTTNEETADKEWLSVDEVAAIYGLPKNNIKDRSWRIENDFPFQGFDERKGAYNKVIFNSEDVKNWIRNHE